MIYELYFFFLIIDPNFSDLANGDQNSDDNDDDDWDSDVGEIQESGA